MIRKISEAYINLRPFLDHLLLDFPITTMVSHSPGPKIRMELFWKRIGMKGYQNTGMDVEVEAATFGQIQAWIQEKTGILPERQLVIYKEQSATSHGWTAATLTSGMGLDPKYPIHVHELSGS